MKESMHSQISAELEQTTKTDKTTVIVAIIINLILLLANSLIAAGVISEEFQFEGQMTFTTTEFNTTVFLIFIILLGATVAFNYFVIRALSKGIERRARLTEGLVKMYQEEGMEKYYDESLILGYKARYALYRNIVIVMALMAVLIPLVSLGL